MSKHWQRIGHGHYISEQLDDVAAVIIIRDGKWTISADIDALSGHSGTIRDVVSTFDTGERGTIQAKLAATRFAQRMQEFVDQQKNRISREDWRKISGDYRENKNC